jgi:hypothetical protein
MRKASEINLLTDEDTPRKLNKKARPDDDIIRDTSDAKILQNEHIKALFDSKRHKIGNLLKDDKARTKEEERPKTGFMLHQ